MGYTFAIGWFVPRVNKLANSWTAEPPFVQARAPKPLCLTPREGTRSASRMTRYCSRSHSGWILLTEQANEMGIEINFVDAIGRAFEPYPLANKGSSDKTFSASPFDVATVAHPPCIPRARILQWG